MRFLFSRGSRSGSTPPGSTTVGYRYPLSSPDPGQLQPDLQPWGIYVYPSSSLDPSQLHPDPQPWGIYILYLVRIRANSSRINNRGKGGIYIHYQVCIQVNSSRIHNRGVYISIIKSGSGSTPPGSTTVGCIYPLLSPDPGQLQPDPQPWGIYIHYQV